MSDQLHVIVGAGAVGRGTALELADRGHRVRVITRSGGGPDHPSIERTAFDASDRARLAEACVDAHALYNCANPPYSKWASAWPPLHEAMMHAAETTGARLVIMSNLYGYAENSSPMRPADPLDPPTQKGQIRADMWASALAAHEAGRLRAVEVRASDFFGPGIGDSAHMGDRVVKSVTAGKSAMVVGAADQPHSWTYIGDVAKTLATVGTDDRSLGRAWHVPTGPPLTAQQLVDAIAAGVGKEPAPVRRLPRFALRVAGWFSADLREVAKMVYQFDEPFVMDHEETTAVFGLEPTPLSEQISSTVGSLVSSSV